MNKFKSTGECGAGPRTPCGLMNQLKSPVEITPEVLCQAANTCNIIKCNPRELSRDEVYEI